MRSASAAASPRAGRPQSARWVRPCSCRFGGAKTPKAQRAGRRAPSATVPPWHSWVRSQDGVPHRRIRARVRVRADDARSLPRVAHLVASVGRVVVGGVVRPADAHFARVGRVYIRGRAPVRADRAEHTLAVERAVAHVCKVERQFARGHDERCRQRAGRSGSRGRLPVQRRHDNLRDLMVAAAARQLEWRAMYAAPTRVGVAGEIGAERDEGLSHLEAAVVACLMERRVVPRRAVGRREIGARGDEALRLGCVVGVAGDVVQLSVELAGGARVAVRRRGAEANAVAGVNGGGGATAHSWWQH
mmetsp:Transcript_31656/g.78068  ORF Transcript_31656/g.78068 Transcript_31656/m.78068 type:complete len:303 (+) Transcript_31656:978-1886(+)